MLYIRGVYIRSAYIRSALYCWNHELTQKRIQEWIERIPRHIAEVIRLKGGNEYREGREEGDVRPYNSTKRANEYIRSYMKHHH